MIYFDTSYIVRLYLEDTGWRKVRALATSDHLACCLHGRAEAVAAFHRRFSKGTFGSQDLRSLLGQFARECDAGAFQWLPLSPIVIVHLTNVYASLPKSVLLRAPDGLHLACAAENGFKDIYSNDQRLLSAASHFGLRGKDVI